ncbi:polysaccharide pyruvyl transferase family protein [Shewanella olleyana]|uniref:polysaccharide pyruvyl transferase family protein n=1 Tax=Shewanella olleyana TaxID=135626 RepID=UPI00200D07FE|nr:polysaccharide pyruvyl transferase family protein [Shewanella olleyana]MCL1065346.1 polysaccharide pyruvyl transferase family protein [Shewanella olleyana]
MDSIVFFRPITQYENLGDLVINQELLKLLPENCSIIIEAKGVPEWFVKALVADVKIESIITEKKRFYKRVLQSIFGKTKTYFLDVPGHVFYKDADKSAWFRYLKMRVFSLIGIRYVRLGVSLGPYGKSALTLEKKKSKVYAFTGVRETYSHQYLRSVNITKFTYFPDFGLCLPFVANTSLKTNSVGYSFRAGVVSADANSAENTKPIIDAMLNLKTHYELTPVVQVNLDDDYMSLIAESIKPQNEAVTFLEHDQTAIFDVYSKVKFVVSNRLHVLIFALSRGAIAVPYIDREKHTKVTGVFEDIGLGDAIFDIRHDKDIEQHLISTEALYHTLDVGGIFKTKKAEIESLLSQQVFVDHIDTLKMVDNSAC